MPVDSATPRDLDADIAETTRVLATVNGFGKWMAQGMIDSVVPPVFETIQHVTALRIAAKVSDAATAAGDPAVTEFALDLIAELAGMFPVSTARLGQRGS